MGALSQSHLKYIHIMNVKLISLLVVVLATTTSAQKRQSGDEGGGLFLTVMRPVLRLVQATTRQVVNQIKKTVTAADSQAGAVRDTVQQLASDIGRNALGDVIDNIKLLRGRVQRLLNVVRGAQKSIQSLMDNDNVNVAIKAVLSPAALTVAGLEGQVAGLNAVLNAGSGIQIAEPITDGDAVEEKKSS